MMNQNRIVSILSSKHSDIELKEQDLCGKVVPLNISQEDSWKDFLMFTSNGIFENFKVRRDMEFK